MFDAVKRRAVFNPAHSTASASVSSSGSSDLAHISSIISNLVNRNGSMPLMPVTPIDPSVTTPSKATSIKGPTPSLPPPRPSPSKLPRFLLYAQQKLGVPNAMDFEFALSAKGYGPDILHLVPDDALLEAGMSHGDVIRVKLGCVDWWSGQGKRGHNAESEGSDRTPPNKKVRYERKWAEGGARTFYGPILVPGKQSLSDRETSYYCTITKRMVPLPQGYTLIADEDDEDPFHL